MVKNKEKKMNLLYYESSIGVIEIRATEKWVETIRFVEKKEKVENPNEVTIVCGKQLNEYFLGKIQKINVAVKSSGTAFEEKVWAELCKIPYGETSTYKKIAQKIGNEKAVRAVGTAIGKNPIAIVVPCHRVIGSNGKMVGYAYGITRKEELLKLEKENKDKLNCVQ